MLLPSMTLGTGRPKISMTVGARLIWDTGWGSVLFSPEAFDNQRDMCDFFVHGGTFGGQGMGVEHIAVIRGVDNYRIRRIFFRRVQYLSYFVVNKGNCSQR